MASDIQLTIPQSDRRGLALLLNLPQEGLQELKQAIKETPPSLLARDFASHVAKKVTITTDDITEIIRVIVTLYSVRADVDLPIAAFVDKIIEAMKEAESEELSPQDDNWEGFQARVTELLSFDYPLGVIAKSVEVMLENEHNFHSARVLSDLRPIFGNDPSEQPAACVILHQLKISYHEGNQLKEFFITLSTEEIRQLRTVLNRAEAKAQSLKALMDSVSVPMLEGESS